MELRASIIIATYRRDGLLYDRLRELQAERLEHVEYIVVDDGPGEDSTRRVARDAGARHLWLGREQRQWRIPGYAFNAGVQAAQAPIVVLTESEIMHIDGSLDQLISVVEQDHNILAYPGEGKRDRDNKWNGRDFDDANLVKLNAKLIGFLSVLDRSHYLAIGGFDEDFVRRGRDDVDMMDRLEAYGVRFESVPMRIVHRWHDAFQDGHQDMPFNKEIYKDRLGTIFRNGATERKTLHAEK